MSNRVLQIQVIKVINVIKVIRPSVWTRTLGDRTLCLGVTRLDSPHNLSHPLNHMPCSVPSSHFKLRNSGKLLINECLLLRPWCYCLYTPNFLNFCVCVCDMHVCE